MYVIACIIIIRVYICILYSVIGMQHTWIYEFLQWSECSFDLQQLDPSWKVCSGSLFQRRAASYIALARVLRAGLVQLRETTTQRKLYRPAPVLTCHMGCCNISPSDRIWSYLINIIPPDPPEFEWVTSRVQVAKVQWLCRHQEEGFYPPCTHGLCAEGLTGRSQIAEEKWKDRGGNWRNARIYHWTFTFLGSPSANFPLWILDRVRY